VKQIFCFICDLILHSRDPFERIEFCTIQICFRVRGRYSSATNTISASSIMRTIKRSGALAKRKIKDPVFLGAF
jgi:hypothetical protein